MSCQYIGEQRALDERISLDKFEDCLNIFSSERLYNSMD